MTIQYGDWVRRSSGPAIRIHHVDSTVAGDVVTQCGKRIRGSLGAFEVVQFPAPWDKCKVCK